MNRIESSLFILLFKDSQAFRVFTGAEPKESSDKGGGESLPTQKRERIYVNFIDADEGKHLYMLGSGGTLGCPFVLHPIVELLNQSSLKIKLLESANHQLLKDSITKRKRTEKKKERTFPTNCMGCVTSIVIGMC